MALRYRVLAAAFFLTLVPTMAQAALNIPLTVNMSETVTVDTTGGTPRIPVDVGGNIRYATYTSGSGTSALTFTLTPTVGDVDLDGITVSSPVDLNGGTIKDSAGNNATLTFSLPNTSGIKVDYPSLSMDFANSDYILNGTHYATLPSFLTAAGGSFTRASIGTYYDSLGVLQTAASGAPRFDYDPTTHVAKGILIEEQRTNLFKYSAQFDNAYWSKTSSWITPDLDTSIDGGMNADYFYSTNPSGVWPGVLVTETVSSGQAYTVSLWAKAAEWSDVTIQMFGMPTPTIISSTHCTLTATSYTQCKLSFNTGTYSSVQTRILFSGAAQTWTGTKGFYIWGAQLEQGTFATSYIPTTSAAVTRAGDILKIPTGSWYNTSNSSVLVKYNAPSSTTVNNRGVWSLNNGTNDKSDLRANGISVTSIAGAGVENMGLSVNVVGDNKVAKAIQLNNYALVANGGTVVTNTSAAVPSVARLQVGGLDNDSSGTLNLTGNIGKIGYYPLRVSNSQLQLLTQ